MHQVVRIKGPEGARRVLDGKDGMTFIVDCFTKRINSADLIAHVRDYRFDNGKGYQIWSIGPDGYEVVS